MVPWSAIRGRHARGYCTCFGVARAPIEVHESWRIPGASGWSAAGGHMKAGATLGHTARSETKLIFRFPDYQPKWGADNAPGLYSINLSPRTCYLAQCHFCSDRPAGRPMQVLHIKVSDENAEITLTPGIANFTFDKKPYLADYRPASPRPSPSDSGQSWGSGAAICAQLCRGMLSGCQRARYRLSGEPTGVWRAAAGPVRTELTVHGPVSGSSSRDRDRTAAIAGQAQNRKNSHRQAHSNTVRAEDDARC